MCKDDKPKPFLQWVGGKRQLLDDIDTLLPREFSNGGVDTYIESFVGGGALFFHIHNTYDIKRAILIDLDEELVIAYNVVKHNVGELIEELRGHSVCYASLGESDKRDYFYRIRDEFNSFDKNVDANQYDRSFIRRAALMIFLNKTCFNGLYRVNRDKKFNTSFGRNINPKILDDKNLILVSQTLANVEIIHGDFSVAANYIKGSTFIYHDPPYKPLTKTSSFTRYNATQFTDSHQTRLIDFIFSTNKIDGVKQMLSNSSSLDIRITDDFAYHTVYARRAINCKGDKRGKIKEIIITNY